MMWRLLSARYSPDDSYKAQTWNLPIRRDFVPRQRLLSNIDYPLGICVFVLTCQNHKHQVQATSSFYPDSST